MSHDTHHRYEWNAIPWRKLEVKVFKLQRRIYQATTRGETKKAHRLQKLLASSWSAKSLAVRRVTQENKGKKTAGVDGASNLTPPQRLKLISTMDLHAPVNPVRRIWIPKPGKPEKRPLGIPIMHDRGTQALAKMALEPEWEAKFEPNSFGFRPGRSCQDAIRHIYNVINIQPRYVLDADIASCFDNIDHALLLRALRKHTVCPWVLLYVARWLEAPVQDQEGTLVQRGQGVPQGGCISPVLANLFLHYAFDAWMHREQPSIPFERYADDIIAHCQSEAQARWLHARIATRLAQCHLELHPDKTHIVYCKDADRRGTSPQERFDFLGYTFRPRRSKNRQGKYFINFTPAVSTRATTAMRQTIRSWRLHLRSDKTLDDLSRMFNPTLGGWVQYYGQYYKSALYPTFRVLDRILVRWAMRKYKKLKGHQRRATHWLGRIAQRQPRLFVHWQMGVRPAAGR